MAGDELQFFLSDMTFSIYNCIPCGIHGKLILDDLERKYTWPEDMCLYLPYQTSIVKSAGAELATIIATRRTSTANNMDLTRFWRNRNRRQGGLSGRYDWISNGAALIDPDILP